MKIVLVTLAVSFVLNFLWENLHARFYTQHLGRRINQKILFIASLGDVIILSFFALLWNFIPLFQINSWLVIPLGLIIAAAIEKYALARNRWSYHETMPIVPYLNIGWTPFIQLACTGFILLIILESIA
jgi:hypothetical protein